MTATPELVPEIVPRQPAPLDVADGHRRFTKAEAIEITNQIRGSANWLWVLVSAAHDRYAWRAMGYETWKDYVTIELGLSESRSYQLIDTGRVMLTIAEATGQDPYDLDPVPARTVQKVKPHLRKLQHAITAYLAENPEENRAAVIEAALLEVVPKTPKAAASGDPKEGRGGGLACPACAGGGDLGTGKAAEQLYDWLENALKRYFSRGNPKPRQRRVG